MSTSLKRKQISSGLSVTQKVFVRSRRGKASKIVREHYLRDDIPCGSQACEACDEYYFPDPSGFVRHPVLSKTPLKIEKKSIGKHYVIPDTNVVLNAIDMLENDKVFYDVIIPQTVLEEVRNKSYPIYMRLRGLCKSEDKRFVVFHNEFKASTYLERKIGETMNDYNDRLIRKCAIFYGEHLQDAGISIVLVTGDRANREKAQKNSILTLSLPEYISLLPNSIELQDMLPTSGEFSSNYKEIKYPSYFSAARLIGGIKAGSLHQGTINISSYNFLEGTVAVPNLPKPLLILGRENLNRAFNGDKVVVEILSKNNWKKPSTKIIDEEAVNQNGIGDDDDEVMVTDKERIVLAQEAVKAQKAFLQDGDDDQKVLFPLDVLLE
ncbi:hypothetical protein HII13_001809 [Brettanomyces bruxellensis]|nr:hypothetical protein HII13_001809 [Brettanomyces bruxellensis]